MCKSERLSPSNMINRRAVLAGMGGVGAVLLGATACSPAETTGAPTASSSAVGAVTVAGESAPCELVLLGTYGGPPIEADRAGIASALVVDGATYVVDCGRGATTQYTRAGLSYEALRSIFITHLHADHVADYYNFFLLAGSVPNSHGDSIAGPVGVYGPGPAGGLPPKLGGGVAPTVAEANPTPGIADLTERCHEAYAYSSNVFMRNAGVRDIRTLAAVQEIVIPNTDASFENTSPPMAPFEIMRDDKVRVSAILVPHGPIFPAFAFRFDTAYGSVTFSGDTTYSDNLVTLAHGTDVLVHEATNLEGAVNTSPELRSHALESHVEVQQVGAIAQRCGAKRLVVSHFADRARTPVDTQQWHEWASRGFDGDVIIGADLQRIPVGT